jgi:hypothetical protein
VCLENLNSTPDTDDTKTNLLYKVGLHNTTLPVSMQKSTATFILPTVATVQIHRHKNVSVVINFIV